MRSTSRLLLAACIVASLPVACSVPKFPDRATGGGNVSNAQACGAHATLVTYSDARLGTQSPPDDCLGRLSRIAAFDARARNCWAYCYTRAPDLYEAHRCIEGCPPVPPEIELGAGPDAAIARGRVRFKACYREALRIDPTVSGSMKLTCHVGADGAMTHVTILETSAPMSLAECVKHALESLTFP